MYTGPLPGREGGFGHLFGTSAAFAVVGSVCGKPPAGSAAFPALVFLLLVATLPTSGSFLIARSVADTLYLIQSAHASPGAERSLSVPAHELGDANRWERDEILPPGSERLRDILEVSGEAGGITDITSATSVFAGLVAGEGARLEATLMEPEAVWTLPPKLLCRPPPAL